MKKKRINKITTAILLLGGKGSRFSLPNEIPKQLVKLSKHNILMEILLKLKKCGINYFVLPLGYKKRYFLNFFKSSKIQSRYNIKVIKNIKNDKIEKNKINVCLFDAGTRSTKLNRIFQSLNYFEDKHFLTTYGDGIANVNFRKLFNMYFKINNKLIMTSFRTRSQYGHVVCNRNNLVTKFIEKPIMELPINIGFYVMSKNIIKLYYENKIELENEFLPKLCQKKMIKSFIHKGYFHSIDDKKDLIDAKKKLK